MWHKVRYIYSVENGNIITYKHQQINTKIHILNSATFNAIGNYYVNDGKLFKSALSKSWYYKHISELDTLRKTTRNVLRNVWKAKSSEILVVTFSQFQKYIEDDGFKSAFIACNSKSYNKYGDRLYMAFLVNIYLNPNIKGFLEAHNIKVDEDKYTLSTMIQVLFRSILRNGGELNLFIPSERMRNILVDFIIQNNITRKKADKTKISSLTF